MVPARLHQGPHQVGLFNTMITFWLADRGDAPGEFSDWTLGDEVVQGVRIVESAGIRRLDNADIPQHARLEPSGMVA